MLLKNQNVRRSIIWYKKYSCKECWEVLLAYFFESDIIFFMKTPSIDAQDMLSRGYLT